MKITRSQLRRLIRQNLVEVYQPVEADYEEVANKTGVAVSQLKADLATDPLQRRITGLQTQKEVEADRNYMRKHQETYKHGIREIHSAILSGDVTVMHSLTYSAGTEGSKGSGAEIFKKASAVRSWLQMNGKKGNVSLSTTIFDIPYLEFVTGGILTKLMHNANDRGRKGGNPGNALQMIKPGTQGLILKGYPVISGKIDLGTQTRSTVPANLLKHQKSSGFAKRPAIVLEDDELIKDLEELKAYGGTEETILDSWTVIAPYYVANDSLTIEQLKNDKSFVDVFTNPEKYIKLYDIYSKISEIHSSLRNKLDVDYYTGPADLFIDWIYSDEIYANWKNDADSEWEMKAKDYFNKEVIKLDEFKSIESEIKPILSLDSLDRNDIFNYMIFAKISKDYKLDQPIIF